jgi:hypothetical protein
MKKTLLFFLLLASLAVTGQTETFELLTYAPPAGWQKEMKNNATSYFITDKKDNAWCRITIFKSTLSKGTIEENFESEWTTLVKNQYEVTEAPETSDVQEAEGWKIKAASGKFIFDKANAMVLITTITGYNRCLSIVALTNKQRYLSSIQTFVLSINLQKPDSTVSPIDSSKTTIDNTSPVLGIWGQTSTANSAYAMNNGLHSYIQKQYSFNKDGTYSFISRSFSYLPDIFMVKETGTYQVSGNTITIIPKKSVIEKWSKGFTVEKDGRKVYLDKLGKLQSGQQHPIEKKTYSFTKHYFSGIGETNLVLQADEPTQRDGPFNGGNAFGNAWLYKPITSPQFLVKTD